MGWSDARGAMEKLRAQKNPGWDNYLGFYSSWLGGYFREPWAMLIPMDDHGFHRGDGVFEAVRIVEHAYFDLRSHLERLARSAMAIGLKLPWTLNEIQGICVELAHLCEAQQGILRLYVSRGPGGFSPNPRESVGPQLYMAITKMRPPDPTQYERGVRALIGTVAAKEPFWSQIKSLNYLQNVMMKSECLERGFDFAICADHEGRLCEGSTENLMLVTPDGDLVVPRFDYTLRGTTVSVVLNLADELVQRGELRSAGLGDVRRGDLLAAREAAFVGTTLGVLPMTEVDGEKIGDGRPGPSSRALHQSLMKVMTTSNELRTTF